MDYIVGEPIVFEIYEGLIYQTPPLPKIESIRGSNLKKEDQVWTRNRQHEKWKWNDDPKRGACWWDDPQHGQIKWYYEEIDRILNGEWVMINGVPTFLNLFAYFYFQWFVTKEGTRPQYKDTCVLFMRFLEIVFKDQRCRGGNTMKGRRKHVSTMCMSVMLQFGLIKQNTEQGITSKEAIDAEKIFKLMLVNGYSRLPNFLKPRISGNDLPVKTMHIVKQSGRITKDSQTGGDKEGLNNKIEWRAPNLNVFDGDGLWFLLLDECGKWAEIPIDDYLEIALNIIVAGNQIGRIMCITTVNRGDKGGDRYKIVWDNSNQLEKDGLGQTSNKLYRLFIPGYMGGRDGGWIDKYGNSVWDTPTLEQAEWLKQNSPQTLNPNIGCKQYCDLQRAKKLNEPEKLQEEIRMFPFNPKEVFHDANNMCHFNIAEINEQKERLSAKLEYASIYRKGLFVMDDNGRVHFKDTDDKSNERFYWYILELLDEGESNKSTWQNGQKTPTNTAFGAGGADLVNNTEKTAEKGSDAAMCIFKRYNALDPENSNMIVALGVGRPTSVLQQHEQLFWAAQYYGVKLLVERAPITWFDYADAKKILGYCIKTTQKIGGKDVYGISAQDAEGREQHLTEMIEYASFGMGKIWYTRILEDMMHFNVRERTLYDGCMAFGYSLMALKERYLNNIPVYSDEQPLIKMYDIRKKMGVRFANR